MGGDQDLSFDDINPAFLGVEQLILALDYAMWHCIAYEGKPDDARVSLVQGPEQERSGAIDAYLRDHRDELRVKWLQCPTCKKVVLEVSETRCNACRVALEPELASEEELRGRAWERLIWTIPGAQARYIVPMRLVQKLTPGQTVSGEYQLPKNAVLSHLVKFVRLVKDRDIGRCWEHLNIKSPSTLVPQGANLEERHGSYLVTRERLLAGYNWLTGIARQYPEFMDDYEQHKAIRRFPPALTLEEARGEPALADDDAEKPEWDRNESQLRFRGTLVKELRPVAHSQIAILDAFETSGWLPRVPNPLGTSDKQRLRETISNLNDRCQGIRFLADGRGEGVKWEAVEASSTEQPSRLDSPPTP